MEDAQIKFLYYPLITYHTPKNLGYQMKTLARNRLKSFLCSTKDGKKDTRDLVFQHWHTHVLIERRLYSTVQYIHFNIN